MPQWQPHCPVLIWGVSRGHFHPRDMQCPYRGVQPCPGTPRTSELEEEHPLGWSLMLSCGCEGQTVLGALTGIRVTRVCGFGGTRAASASTPQGRLEHCCQLRDLG